HEAVLLRAVDELLETRDLGDGTWAELAAELDPRRAIELLLLVGHYDMLATTLTTLRVPPDRRR
ncbi:MAG: carboxymuconolactone decarboxylase family protein, partial [Marmoricola sp.]